MIKGPLATEIFIKKLLSCMKKYGGKVKKSRNFHKLNFHLIRKMFVSLGQYLLQLKWELVNTVQVRALVRKSHRLSPTKRHSE
jgi:hypothetical protein